MLKFGENAKSSEKNRIFASKKLAYEEIWGYITTADCHLANKIGNQTCVVNRNF